MPSAKPRVLRLRNVSSGEHGRWRRLRAGARGSLPVTRTCGNEARGTRSGVKPSRAAKTLTQMTTGGGHAPRRLPGRGQRLP